jgi:hypothetical protein
MAFSAENTEAKLLGEKLVIKHHSIKVYEGSEICTRAVRNVSSHFEYLKNQSRGPDVTWQPVREDLTVYP